jgi:Tol biopolymer transport system component
LAGSTGEPTVSANGRFVAFASSAPLALADANGGTDVFVRDRRRHLTTLVSRRISGQSVPCPIEPSLVGPYSCADAPAISADGRFVAFHSHVDDLVAGDTNRAQDVFVRDLASGITRRVSMSSSGAEGDADSGIDGHHLSISADGRLVAFASNADNLVAGDTNSAMAIFVSDLRTGEVSRVTVDSRGRQADGPTDSSPMLSATGRFVLFFSSATNLARPPIGPDRSARLYLRDRRTGTTERIPTGAGAQAPRTDPYPEAAISADGRYVAFSAMASDLVSGDRNSSADVFVRDRRRDITDRVSVDSQGQATRCSPPKHPRSDFPTDYYCSRYPSISNDGRFVLFESWGNHLVAGDRDDAPDVFIRDRRRKRTRHVETGDRSSQTTSYAVLSANARYVAFGAPGNLLTGGVDYYTGVFVRGPLVWSR